MSAPTTAPSPKPMPRYSGSNRVTENGDTEGRSGRVGLSDYTSQRLAELRARRAEQAEGAVDPPAYKPRTQASAAVQPSTTTSTPSVTSSSGATSPISDYSESYRSRRSRDTNGTSKATSSDSKDSAHIRDYSTSSLATRSASTASDYVSSKGLGAGAAVMRSSSMRVGNDRDDDECVGFASLPDQVHRKAVKRGFDFTLMVVGETGLGKSTLISSLFLNPSLYDDRKIEDVQARIQKTVQMDKKTMDIEEKGIKVRLTIVDTPGFNDAIIGEQNWRPIEEYIQQQFEQYFKDETGLNRKNIKDHRVHCCLYFLSPIAHGLRQIDVQFMKRLHDKVNIVPIIAKADTLTPSEICKLKKRVMEEVEKHGIQIYDFPECDSDEDEEFKQQDKELKAATPFAVIGSNTLIEVNGKRVRGRLYPWGVVEVDNPKHCDFSKLRQFLISTHMQDLKDVTRDVHYENYRARHIKEQLNRQSRERTFNSSENGVRNCMAQTPDASKLKRDSAPNFEAVQDQDALLEQKDQEIIRMKEMLAKMQAQLESNKPAVNGST